MKQIRSALVCYMLLNACLALAAQPARFQGKSLEEALKQLQLQGLNIVFSSELVRPDMKVGKEPAGSSQWQILGELLYPHGLRIQAGPQHTILVVPGTHALADDGPMAPDEFVLVPFATVYFTAQDQNKRPVRNLKVDNFIFYEDGKRLPLVDVSYVQAADRPPITFFFLLDSSSSMRKLQDGTRKYDAGKQILLRLIDELQPQDQLTVLGFHERCWTIADMSRSSDPVRKALLQEKEGPTRTALYDALAELIKTAMSRQGRNIIVLFSDGEDNLSKSSLQAVLQLLRYGDTTLMAFGTTGQEEQQGRRVLQTMADASGGSAFFVSRGSDLDAAIAEFRNVMDGQYIAGYVPPEPTVNRKREVRLYCTVPGVNLSYRKSCL